MYTNPKPQENPYVTHGLGFGSDPDSDYRNLNPLDLGNPNLLISSYNRLSLLIRGLGYTLVFLCLSLL